MQCCNGDLMKLQPCCPWCILQTSVWVNCFLMIESRIDSRICKDMFSVVWQELNCFFFKYSNKVSTDFETVLHFSKFVQSHLYHLGVTVHALFFCYEPFFFPPMNFIKLQLCVLSWDQLNFSNMFSRICLDPWNTAYI